MDEFDGIWPTNFSKGLPGDVHGIPEQDGFKSFVSAIGSGDSSFSVPLGPQAKTKPGSIADFLTISPDGTPWSLRKWESPIAGHVYDLEGLDAGSAAMAAAPRLGGDELAGEMAETYAMALLRDVSFEDIRTGTGEAAKVAAALGRMAWFDRAQTATDYQGAPLSEQAKARRKARFDGKGALTPHALFRGSSPGCMDGPYLSQFLLQGNVSRGAVIPVAADTDGSGASSNAVFNSFSGSYRKSEPRDGYITFGAQRIDQRINPQCPQLDYLTDWAEWLDVQHAARTNGEQKFIEGPEALRFIDTPRHLATYVHFDALYQAYVNACLLLISADAKGDDGLPETTHPTRDPFATFGPPHILTLVTESATRSLKAVRRQKFNYHLRARPEAMGALASLSANGLGDTLGAAKNAAAEHVAKLQAAQADEYSLMQAVHTANANMPPRFDRSAAFPVYADEIPDISAANYMLAMAFPEGSPMHAAYGAGHATVAGSCVTVLKAFYEMFAADGTPLALSAVGDGSLGEVLVPVENGVRLDNYRGPLASELSLQGELNKLAANISIGRNMAGVHYYSDYYDSLRMGERIAVGLLLEQMVTYPEPVSMRFDDFDGIRIALSTDGSGSALLSVGGSSLPSDLEAWWSKNLP